MFIKKYFGYLLCIYSIFGTLDDFPINTNQRFQWLTNASNCNWHITNEYIHFKIYTKSVGFISNCKIVQCSLYIWPIVPRYSWVICLIRLLNDRFLVKVSMEEDFHTYSSGFRQLMLNNDPYNTKLANILSSC